VPLRNGSDAWFLGDTFTGDVVDGHRTSFDMVHNAVGMETPDGHMHFECPQGAEFQPTRSGEWYWPGYGLEVHGEVYMFAKAISNVPGPAGFSFQWDRSDLVEVRNPQAPPQQWQYSTRSVPGTPETGLYGTAGVRDGSWLYLYGITDGQARVARTRAEKLPALHLSYWTGHAWSSQAQKARPLFDGGATEMSVCKVPGRSGYYAVYTQDGVGRDIVMRHAEQPEGPWSDAQVVYRCPETGLFNYAAKAHPELSSKDGELVVTYCCNPPDFNANVDPSLYRPRAIKLHIPQ
jgi:hypothetical protein